METDWSGWTGLGLTIGGLFSAAHYFQRAYGFSSESYNNLPRGAVAAIFFCAVFGVQYIPSALYAQYFDESILGLGLIYLALAGLIVAPLRAALGKAPEPPAASPDESSELRHN